MPPCSRGYGPGLVKRHAHGRRPIGRFRLQEICLFGRKAGPIPNAGLRDKPTILAMGAAALFKTQCKIGSLSIHGHLVGIRSNMPIGPCAEIIRKWRSPQYNDPLSSYIRLRRMNLRAVKRVVNSDGPRKMGHEVELRAASTRGAIGQYAPPRRGGSLAPHLEWFTRGRPGGVRYARHSMDPKCDPHPPGAHLRDRSARPRRYTTAPHGPTAIQGEPSVTGPH